MTRRRVQLLGAMLFSVVLPYLLRAVLFPGTADQATTINAAAGNVVAVFFALWVRLAVETFPGVRSSSLNLPVATASHAAVMVAILLLRVPYDRLGLTGGYLLHLLWLYVTYFAVQRGSRLSIAVVPFGLTERLSSIDKVDWVQMHAPQLDHVANCQAIVADFGAQLPNEWEAFLADAALDGRIVYQV